jgi:hypothetical protein
MCKWGMIGVVWSTILFSVKLLSVNAISRDSLVSVTTGYGLDGQGLQEIFLFSTVRRTGLWSIQPPIQWVPHVLSPAIKRPGRKAEHSLLSTAEAKNGEGIPLFSHTSPLHGASLNTHRDNFTFCLSISNCRGTLKCSRFYPPPPVLYHSSNSTRVWLGNPWIRHPDWALGSISAYLILSRVGVRDLQAGFGLDDWI